MPGSNPYTVALRAARAGAALAPHVVRRRTATVRENLRLAFGEADEQVVRGVWRHFAEAAVDLMFFSRLYDPDRFEEHFEIAGGGLEHYHESGGGGAILVTGHFGNWELFGTPFLRLGIPITPVVRPPHPAWLARRLDRFRRDQGQETIPKTNAIPLALKAIRGGKAVAFLMDRYAGRHGIQAPFFGRDVQTFSAPAALALKLGIPLYAGYSTRLGPGISYRCFVEPIPVEGDVLGLTAKINAVLEGYVRACPEQWWWFHRRFRPRREELDDMAVSPADIPVMK